MLIGSWGKQTRVGPPRDIDILFLLPPSVYHRFEERSGNRQSALLQEVKETLAETYSQTALRGDGQVVSVSFNNTPVEVAPGFRCSDGSIIVCDTNGGGRYKTSTAEAEALELSTSDTFRNGNTRALVRMMKQWQQTHSIDLKSFHLERLAINFLAQWSFSREDVFWYDWMVRDFFAYLIERANSHFTMPATNEVIFLGAEWLRIAQTSHEQAVKACINERDNFQDLAGVDWQEVFGNAIPVSV